MTPSQQPMAHSSLHDQTPTVASLLEGLAAVAKAIVSVTSIKLEACTFSGAAIYLLDKVVHATETG